MQGLTNNPDKLKKQFRYIAWAVFRTLLITGMVFIILYPLIYMASVSLRPTRELFDPSIVWIPKTFTLEHFRDAIKGMSLSASFGDANPLYNTLTLDIISAVLQTVCAASVGYGFARFRFRGRGPLFALVILSMIVPVNSLVIPMYGNYVRLGLVNSSLSLYVPALLGLGIRAGLCIYIFRQFFRNMPRELEDAAAIDGCGFIKTFYRIFVPNASPALLTVFIFTFVWYWNDFYYSRMFMSTKTTISVALSELASVLNVTSELGRDPYRTLAIMKAGCLIAMLPLLLIYIVLQKYFTESIERTGIVG